MRHQFYPAIVYQEEDRRVLHVPDLSISQEIAAETNPYLVGLDLADAAIGKLRRKKQPIPLPSRLPEIWERVLRTGGKRVPDLVFSVPVAMYADYVRFSMNFDRGLLRQIDAAAAERSMTRTAFLSNAAMAYIGEGYSSGAESPGEAPAIVPAAAMAAPSLR